MTLLEAFDITKNRKEIVSLVGGGGKTTTMFKLAQQLKAEGYRVLVTTTTAIFFPPEEYYDRFLKEADITAEELRKIDAGEIYLLGREINREGKLLGVSFRCLEELASTAIFDIILIEADGSKGRPIKAPASHEPMVFPLTTINIGVIGLDAISKAINEETIHRVDEFCRVTGGQIQGLVSPELVKALVLHDNGIFKNTPKRCKKTLLLNKSDICNEAIINYILNIMEGADAVIVAAMTEKEPIKLWRNY